MHKKTSIYIFYPHTLHKHTHTLTHIHSHPCTHIYLTQEIDTPTFNHSVCQKDYQRSNSFIFPLNSPLTCPPSSSPTHKPTHYIRPSTHFCENLSQPTIQSYLPLQYQSPNNLSPSSSAHTITNHILTASEPFA